MYDVCTRCTRAAVRLILIRVSSRVNTNYTEYRTEYTVLYSVHMTHTRCNARAALDTRLLHSNTEQQSIRTTRSNDTRSRKQLEATQSFSKLASRRLARRRRPTGWTCPHSVEARTTGEIRLRHRRLQPQNIHNTNRTHSILLKAQLNSDGIRKFCVEL